MATSSSSQQPTQMPPSGTQSKTASAGQTTPMENAANAATSSAALAASPTQNPPTGDTSGAAGKTAGTTWNNSAIINGLWGINQDKNSWVGIANIGWIKLSGASESGIVALTMLASHAKQMGSTVYYRQEDDGLIHELYVW